MRQGRRLLFAICVSCAGLAATWFYEQSTRPTKKAHFDKQSLGFVLSANGFHLRRKLDSQLWEPLQDGDLLYSGDHFKTASQGELTLALDQTGTSLDLESDTRVELFLREGEVLLSPLEGYFNLLPRREKAEGSRSLLLQKNNSVETAPKEVASYFKDPQQDLVRLDVNTDGEQFFEGLSWVHPNAQHEVEMNPDQAQALNFEWSGERPQSSIQIEWGPTRRLMTSKKVVEAKKKRLPLLLPLGKHFWRWSVLDSKTNQILWTSPSQKIVVKGLFPPAVLGPTAGTTLRSSNLDEKIPLRWAQDSRFEHYNLQVAADAKFEKILFEKKHEPGSRADFQPQKYGTYFWRIEGIEKLTARSIQTKPHQFKFLSKESEKVEIHWLTQNGDMQRFLGKEPTLDLKWKSTPPGERAYRVRVKPIDGELGRSLTHLIKSSPATVPLDRPGSFQVLIEALNSESDVIGISPPLELSSRPQPLLRAPAFASEGLVASGQGQILLSWIPLEGAREYQVDIQTPEGKTYSQNAKKNELLLKKLLPGEYRYWVTALDSHARPGERSPAGRFTVPEKSSLRKPKIRKVEVE